MNSGYSSDPRTSHGTQSARITLLSAPSASPRASGASYGTTTSTPTCGRASRCARHPSLPCILPNDHSTHLLSPSSPPPAALKLHRPPLDRRLPRSATITIWGHAEANVAGGTSARPVRSKDMGPETSCAAERHSRIRRKERMRRSVGVK